MTEPQAPYTTTNHKPPTIATYHAVIALADASCNPAALFDADGSADRFAWMNAIQRGYIEIVRVFKVAEPDDAPAVYGGAVNPAGLLSYKVIGTPAAIEPEPVDGEPDYSTAELLERIRDDESELDRLAEAVCNLQGDRDELGARLNTQDQQLFALFARIERMGDVKTLAEQVARIDARLRASEEAARRIEGDHR